jgi:hypothetical protein
MKRWRVMFIVILGLIAALLFANSWSKPHAEKLSVRLVAMTNDLAGTRIAIFTLRSTGLAWVYVADPMIELRNQPLTIGGGFFFRTQLSPVGQPKTVQVVMPKTQSEWRVAFHYYSEDLRQGVREVAALLGIQMRSHSITFSTVHSDWMAPTSLQNTRMAFSITRCLLSKNERPNLHFSPLNRTKRGWRQSTRCYERTCDCESQQRFRNRV